MGFVVQDSFGIVMRAFLWFLFLIGIVAAILFFERDSEWMQDLLVKAGLKEAPIELPIERTLTDNQGRSIESIILGFSENEIAFQRKVDDFEFVIGFDKLAEEDKEFFAGREPQKLHELERVRKLQADLALQQKLKDRHASWHRDIQMAKRDAETTKLPLCLLLLSTDGYISNELDRFVVQSEDFRNWANRRVVLCLYYNDPPFRTQQSGLETSSKIEVQTLAQRYRVGSNTPAFVILNPDATLQGNVTGYAGEATSVVINRLEKILEGKKKFSRFDAN